MCAGIALALTELPPELMERHGLAERLFERGGEKEVRFLYRHARPVLPVLRQGQLEIVCWGARRGDSKELPCTGWTWQSTVEAGEWGRWEAEAVDVPAMLALENGIWYRVRQGLRGLVVTDENDTERVYIICEPASHYYQVMTRSTSMPVFIDQRI
jgi:hypothetical protein